ncbi:MAG: SpoIIIAH-like family protein [Firmicutes bacterium]|jgi:stage III sporulation protein AH|nr:SpoIIIAH-like family protein [Bacillota bacterium]
MHWRVSSATVWLLICVGVLVASALYLHNQQVVKDNSHLPLPPEKDEESSLLSEQLNSKEQRPEARRQDFYVEQRLERERVRSQKIDTLREIIHNPATDEENRKEAHAQLLQITEELATEVEIEALIKAKDFPDALVYLHPDSVHVLVKVPELSAEQAAQIGDIVNKSLGLPLDKIIIDTRP